MKWINVKDKLPEIGYVILIYDGHYVREGEFRGKRNKPRRNIFVYANSNIPIETVTFWGFMPEAPKGE